MRAARGEAEQHVARHDRAAVDDPLLLHDANAETGKVVFVRDESLRVLGGLAAHERAARKLAAGGDAFHDLGGDAHIEALAHVIVEEEKRFCALDDDVICAHRHQIDADRVVAIEPHGDLQLRADAIGPRDQHRLAILLRDLAKRAEAADARQHFGPQRLARIGLDGLDQRVARLDVNAGVAVGKTVRHARVQNST